MGAFGGMLQTTKGRNLQAKAQTGVKLNFTRIGVGDGELGGTSILDLNALKHEVKSLSISKFKASAGQATVGAVLSNQDITSGFYWRELGLFAEDPDIGEILYCYGNAGGNAEYIPAGGGADIIEKAVDIISIIANATNVSATINTSLVYASAQDLQEHENDSSAHGLASKISHSLAQAANDFLVASGVGSFVKKSLAEVKSILGLGSAAYKAETYFETPSGAQEKAEAVQTNLNSHLNENASTSGKGHVQLYDGTDSDSTTMAATAKSVKQCFQYANDGKTAVANAITAKGVSASPSDAFSTLASKIGQISTGKKTFIGQFTTSASNTASIRSLSFSPSVVIFSRYNYGNRGAWIKNTVLPNTSYEGNRIVYSNTYHQDVGQELVSPVSNGFDVKTDMSNTTYMYIAIE